MNERIISPKYKFETLLVYPIMSQIYKNRASYQGYSLLRGLFFFSQTIIKMFGTSACFFKGLKSPGTSKVAVICVLVLIYHSLQQVTLSKSLRFLEPQFHGDEN